MYKRNICRCCLRPESFNIMKYYKRKDLLYKREDDNILYFYSCDKRWKVSMFFNINIDGFEEISEEEVFAILL